MAKGTPKILTPKILVHRRRWSHKGRVVSMLSNIHSLMEDELFTTECERLQLLRIHQRLEHLLDNFNSGSTQVLSTFTHKDINS